MVGAFDRSPLAATPGHYESFVLDGDGRDADGRAADEERIATLSGGRPEIFGGYFGVLLPCVVVDGRVLKSDGIGTGDSLHVWLQGAIEPPFEMDDERGIVGCASLDRRVAGMVTLVTTLVGDAAVEKEVEKEAGTEAGTGAEKEAEKEEKEDGEQL